MLSVSERLSSIKLKAPLQFLDGSFLFTQEYHENTLASCTTSVYVNLSKNSLILLPNFGKRVQRYELFPNRQNFFGEIFIFYAKF